MTNRGSASGNRIRIGTSTRATLYFDLWTKAIPHLKLRNFSLYMRSSVKNNMGFRTKRVRTKKMKRKNKEKEKERMERLKRERKREVQKRKRNSTRDRGK